MIYLLAFVVLVLATARLTRVFNIDEVSVPTRSWIINKSERTPKRIWLFLTALVRCYWCSGFWVSLLTCTYSMSMAATLNIMTWSQALAILPILTFAVAYAAPWVLDKEEI